ncbi:phosphatase PAP2 family protein [Blastococcus sp. MG754426]|uniref:phosphatase PAP2 family protein n=1 Tax=unclassified Blastococcus TaxID=2619396 RepID=UPI001EF134A7|nr:MULTISPECIES: phosphatase PAP2 family protein [unclassified Blastococcus]MCF6507281.1 phosphatase PAP2 family protein [Blastococcus sp. MG754426]MCF6510767.1 phosphatase PAP2 family protein [Blastococcus sp. MG754427]
MTTQLQVGSRDLGPGGSGPPRAGRSPVHRYHVDLVRVLLGAAVLGLGFLVAQRGELPTFERDLFQLVNGLPAGIFPVVWVVMQLGNAVAVPVLAAAALAARQVRMARDLLVSGLLAYVAADLVKGVVRRERPGGFAVEVNFPEGPVGGLGFISGHSAVAAALATAAVPYLSRRMRRVVWVLAWSVALGRIYVGAHLPLDVVGGVAVGWAIGSLVHWVFGVPRREVDPRRLSGLLTRLGMPVRDLCPAEVDARSSHPFEATTAHGWRLYVKYLEPDRAERDWLYRLYRLLAVRDVKDADAVAPLGQQAEHEAVAAMTARERGVRTPRILLARGDDRGAVVVQEFLPSRPLDELPAEALTPELLDAVWEQVGLLRQARVAHHDLVAGSVVVDDVGRPWIVDFGNALTGASDDSLAGDVAELLAALALLVEPRLVVASAVDRLGPAPVAAALPALAPLSLSSATRARLRARPDRLHLLRAEIRARLGLPDPDRPEFAPAGWPARTAVAVGSLGALVGVPLLAGAGPMAESVERGGWRWLGAAVALAVLARAAMAVGALLTVERRIALGRTYGAGMVADSAMLLHGHDGWRRAAARFLERAGVLPEAARAALARFTAGAVVAAVLVAVATFALAVVEGRLTGWRTPEALVPAVLVGLGAWALVLTGQWLALRGSGATPARTAPREDVGQALRDLLSLRRQGVERPPWRRGAQLAWTVAGVFLEAAVLAAALHSVGGQVALLATATVYGALHLLWSVVPVTAAPGAADVALLLALTGLGAPLASACAAVLLFRLLTFWLPAAAGAALTARFEHRFGL